jgi:hypothetical protein
MTQPTTTRRDLLRLGTSAAAYAAGAAIVTGGVALASQARGAEPGISPELASLIAEAEQLEAKAAAYNRDVYEPVRSRWAEADSSIPHVEVDGYHGAIWSTDETPRVLNARWWIGSERTLDTENQREQFAAMQRLVAAHDERKALVDKAGNRATYDRVHGEDEENGNRTLNAIYTVTDFECVTLCDLHAKLAFMVKHQMGDGMDWLPEILADVARLSGEEA